MDNVKFHLTPEVKAFLKEKKIVCFTTVPYHPQLNKIENLFGTLKRYVSQVNLATKSLKWAIIEGIKRLDRD